MIYVFSEKKFSSNVGARNCLRKKKEVEFKMAKESEEEKCILSEKDGERE